MIYVVATIELETGKRAAYLEEQKSLLPLVHAEAGCIEYAPTIDLPLSNKTPARDDVIVMIEKWDSVENLKAHGAGQPLKDFRGKTKGMVKSAKVEVFQPA